MAESSLPAPNKPSLSFPKQARLLHRRAFERVQKLGVRLTGKRLILEVAPSKHPFPRLGITVTKKFGSSPERSRFKRICREAFRLSKAAFPPHVDIHVRPRPPVQGMPPLSTQCIAKEYLHLLETYTRKQLKA